MSTKNLKESLDQALKDFSDEIHSNFKDLSQEPATKGDIAELARHTFYALSEFEKAILDYLE